MGARAFGGAAGIVVAAIFVTIEGASDLMRSTVPAALTIAIATLAAGAVGGGLLGPHAWRARSLSQWLRVVLGLALAAVVVGDAVVSVAWGAQVMIGPSDPGIERTLLGVWGAAVMIFFLGLAFVGWFVYPVAVIAATMWAAAIRALRDSETP
jgi:hypothetical protein